MDYELIIKIIEAMKPLKKRYPAIISYAKHLERNVTDETAKRKEVAAFTDWIKSNPRLMDERVFDEPMYEGTRVPGVYFGIVKERGTDEMMNTLVESVKAFVFMNNVDVTKPDNKTMLMRTLDDLDISDAAKTVIAKCKFFKNIMHDSTKFNFLLGLVEKTNPAQSPAEFSKMLDVDTLAQVIGPINEGSLRDIKHDINLILRELNDELDESSKDILTTLSTFFQNPADPSIVMNLLGRITSSSN